MRPLPPGRGLRPRRTLALAAVLLVALLPAPVHAADPAPSAVDPAPYGAAGIGDDYFPEDGNGGVDVQRYEVHDRWRFSDRSLRGRTRVTLTATASLSGFDLDLLLPVRGVTVDGATVAWSRPDAHELRVEAPVEAGTSYDVVVRYAGRPDDLGWAGEHSWLADETEVVAMGEPHMAPWWFAANDHPSDKALFDLHLKARRGLDVVSNGRRVSRVEHGGWTTTHWTSAEPMAPYLAFVAVGDFVVRHGVRDGLPWLVAVSRQVPRRTRQRSLHLMLKSPRVVHWLARRLGAYPFSTTGGLTTSLAPGFALENQTRPTYPVLAAGAVGTVVHELAHQWFGDDVSVARWRDVWLNEGAATFMEVAWTEAHGGESARHWLERRYDASPAGSSFWHLDIADPGPAHLFDRPVYERGAMALEALRQRIGEEAFWSLLRTWLQQRAGGTGSTGQLQALAERVSGEDLSGFFDAWLRARERPARTTANGLDTGVQARR